jgi:hypothetical protein
MRRLLLLLLLAAAPAGAEGIPEGYRGTWAAGSCAAPGALLHVTARGVARLPAEGPARLMRFHALRVQDGWTVGTGGGAEAPRMMLRAAGDALETVEPEAKTRDDRLPGGAAVLHWARCVAPPAPLALLHGEGLAFLGAAERIEAACQGASATDCLAEVVRVGDVSGDGLLGAAEIARLLRGATWALAAQEGAEPDSLVAAAGLGGLAAIAAARLLVEGLDYDGDGRLSAAELGQDRAAFPAGAGAAGGRPMAIDALSDGAGMLRRLIEGFARE